MDVEALVKRLRECGCHYGIPMERTCAEAADALTALSADLSMAQAAAETARNACDHWEARAKELERERDEQIRRAGKFFADNCAAEARATALAGDVEDLRSRLGIANAQLEFARAALEGKDNG